MYICIHVPVMYMYMNMYMNIQLIQNYMCIHVHVDVDIVAKVLFLQLIFQIEKTTTKPGSTKYAWPWSKLHVVGLDMHSKPIARDQWFKLAYGPTRLVHADKRKKASLP